MVPRASELVVEIMVLDGTVAVGFKVIILKSVWLFRLPCFLLWKPKAKSNVFKDLVIGLPIPLPPHKLYIFAYI